MYMEGKMLVGSIGHRLLQWVKLYDSGLLARSQRLWVRGHLTPRNFSAIHPCLHNLQVKARPFQCIQVQKKSKILYISYRRKIDDQL